jgi:hypothetical protein
MDARIDNGWHRLPGGYDVEIRHGVPVRVSDNGLGGTVSDAGLGEEIGVLTGLPVTPGAWTAGEGPGEREAPLYVAREAFAEVLHRLARSSAAVFVDRFQKPVDAGDVDWDRLEYLRDFSLALTHCRLTAAEVDQDAWYEGYVEAMHGEARRLAQARTPPPVEPE